MIKIVDGVEYELTPEEEAEFLASFPPEEEPEPIDREPIRVACALRVTVDGEDVTSLAGTFRIAAMLYLDVGTFLAVFSRNLGEAAPFVTPNNGVSISISEWYSDSAIIEIREHADGPLVTPVSFGFSFYNL